MLLGGFLLGCPPAAKSPDPKEKAKAATGETNAVGEEPAEKPDVKPAAPSPAPVGGGW
jgi:hypothetical protein